MNIKVGDKLPKFTLKDAQGQKVDITSYIGKKNLVIFFYPKNFSPVCTIEVCSFRDNYDEFRNLDAEVIGISADNGSSHAKFIKDYNLPFVLLCDENKAVRKLLGVKATMGILDGRVTYVIDKEGIIKKIISSQLDAKKHISQTLALLKN